jgi:mono/diheme cytochrome c family protein
LTEIPEHLLKRSKSAKASKTGGDPGAGDASTPAEGGAGASPAPATPAPSAAAGPPVEFPNLDPEPVPAKPDSAFVTASKARRRIPVWALPVVAALPIWAIGFAGTMQQPEGEDVLLVEGELFYAAKGCAGCHGASGGGGSGYPLADGEVLATFPEPIDHMVHVARGSVAILDQPYGAERPDGQRVAGARGQGAMPAQVGELSQIELEMVVFHERAVLSGEDTSSPAYQEWMDHMREAFEAGEEGEIDLDLLLACANPEVTPGATGLGSSDEDKPCPGPESDEGEETALGD